jgi:electron transport complex protein RnfB
MTVLFAFLVVGILGAALGIGLGFASKALAVKKDERIEQLEAALPGLNCGACGYAGCASYAEAMASDDSDLTRCTPGGPETAAELGRIMGVEVEVSGAKKVAQVHCRGGEGVSEYSFKYHGLADCNALFILYGGDKICKNGCLGLGSCIRVCPVDAIDYDSEGKVWVDKDACISCGKCLEICPTGVMKWVPYDADYIVACNNTDPPKVVRKHCKVGCIACKICEKKSPEGGYVVENNLSTINYEMTGDRSAGAEKCPNNCIIRVSPVVEVEEPEEPQPVKVEAEKPAPPSTTSPAEAEPATLAGESPLESASETATAVAEPPADAPEEESSAEQTINAPEKTMDAAEQTMDAPEQTTDAAPAEPEATEPPERGNEKD